MTPPCGKTRMFGSPLQSPAVRALGVTVMTFAALGGATMAVSTGALTVVRIGLRQHRVCSVFSKELFRSGPSEVISEQC